MSIDMWLISQPFLKCMYLPALKHTHVPLKHVLWLDWCQCWSQTLQCTTWQSIRLLYNGRIKTLASVTGYCHFSGRKVLTLYILSIWYLTQQYKAPWVAKLKWILIPVVGLTLYYREGGGGGGVNLIGPPPHKIYHCFQTATNCNVPFQDCFLWSLLC